MKKIHALIIIPVFLALNAPGQINIRNDRNNTDLSSFSVTAVNTFITAAVLDDSLVHVVWENYNESGIQTVIVERSIDGSAWTEVNSAVLHNLPDIHALYYPQGMNYFDNILYSTEHGSGRCIYNDVYEVFPLSSNYASLNYRVKMIDFSGNVYVSPVVDGFGTSQYAVDVTPEPEPLMPDLKGDPKPGCNPVQTPPAGMVATSQTQTTFGTCCYWVDTYYQATTIQIPCGGGSYAWCCNNVPGAGSCQSGHVWDPCCVHYCNQYYSCSCHPWNCCQMSQVSQWVTTQSVNDPAITLSAVVINETCTGLFDGAITLSYTNGTAPIVFAWSNGATSQNLTTLAAGTYTVTVTDAHNCTATQSFTVNTNPPPTVTLTPFPSFCDAAQPFVLSGGNPLGGVFSGNGVNNGIFNPPVAGAGTHTITYTYTDANNCAGTATQDIIVFPKPTVSFTALPDVCLTLSPFALSQGAPAGGTYYGVGLNGGVFNPAMAGPGDHTLLYVYTDGNNCTDSATQTIHVDPMPFALFNPVPQLCIDALPIVLTQASPPGGTYSGTGITDSIFDPLAAGVGTHQITYIITDTNSCADTAYQSITVNPLPVVTLSPFADVCMGSQAFALTGGNPAGGNYYGTGINGNLFNPALSGVGTFDVLYIYISPSNCTDSATGTITVNPLPVVTFDPLSPVCVDAPAVTLTTGLPAGGTYSGAGVSGAIFDPAVAGAGTHLLTYTYTDPVTNCTNIATQTIVVNALPVVTLNSFLDVCVTTPTFNLTGGNPAGGTYSGQGVNGNIYDPMMAGVGTWPITYTFTNPNTGCVNFTTQNINVYAGINVNANPSVSAICPGDASNIVMTGDTYYNWMPTTGLSPASGSPVTAAPFVTTTYSILGTDDVGCTGSTTATVNVYPGVNVAIVANPIEGCKPLQTQFFYLPSPFDSVYLWNFDDPGSPDNTSNTVNPIHVYEEEGTYFPNITVYNSYGCVGHDSIPVNVYRIPVADFYTHPEVGSMEAPTITFNDQSLYANYWHWTFGDPFAGSSDTSYLQFPTHTYSDTGTYTVTLVVESQHGCSDTAERELVILPEIHVYVPNAFTPYGDYINDFFAPVISGIDFNSFRMYIFNRWGEKVFETTDYYSGWDGRKNGKVVPQNVYTWLIYFNSVTGREYKMIGHVTVLRNN